MRFAATFDAGDIRKGAAEAVASLKNVSGEAGKTASALDATGGAFRKAAKESGYFYDRLGRLPRREREICIFRPKSRHSDQSRRFQFRESRKADAGLRLRFGLGLEISRPCFVRRGCS